MRSLLAGFLVFLLTIPVLCAELAIHTDFPGGSGVAEINQEARSISLQPTDHPGKGWRCWWYVRLSGITPREIITLTVGDAPWATPKRATFSTDDGQTWQQSEPGTAKEKTMVYQLTFEAEEALIAWGPPFVPSDAISLVRDLSEKSESVTAFNLCDTREGRETPALRVGSAAEKRPLIWIQARQHAWESGSSWVARGFGEWLLSEDPDARQLRETCEIVLVPIMDIDNVHRGAGGKNQVPNDHNRDWDEDPHWNAVAAAQKEIAKAAEEGRLAAFVDLHNPGAGNLFPYFYVPPRDSLRLPVIYQFDRFLKLAQEEIRGPLRFTGKTIESGRSYDPRAWESISKNWVAHLGTPAVALTLETSWNSAASNTEGYRAVGAQLGETLARFMVEGEE